VSPKPTGAIPSNTLVPLAYTEKEVAVVLRISERTVRNLLREGRLVRRKIGASTSPLQVLRSPLAALLRILALRSIYRDRDFCLQSPR
jgi:hypothetical protein